MSGKTGGYAVENGSAATWLGSTDVHYLNRMLKDLCSAYKTYRDGKREKQGGNFNALQHRLWGDISDVASNRELRAGVGQRAAADHWRILLYRGAGPVLPTAATDDVGVPVSYL